MKNIYQGFMDLESVALTNDHATLSKISAERFGYFPEGSYSSKLFYGSLKARAPLINIGYTVRVRMIRHYIYKALSQVPLDAKVCIFSIGAGFDNTYHWFCDAYPQMKFEFFEIDTDIVFKRKAEMLSKSYGYSVSKSEMYYEVYDNYKLIPLDLNQIDAFRGLLEDFARVGCLNIWISECVLCYLEREAADNVLKFAADVPNSYFILYEQLISQPVEPFTKCMLAHFVKSDSPLLSPLTVNGPEEQTKRFASCGFTSTEVTFMSEFLYEYSYEKEAKSILDVQLFDEWEELDLFLSHYAVIYANNIQMNIQPLKLKFKDIKGYMIPVVLESSDKAGKVNLPKYSTVCKYGSFTIVTGGRESLAKVSSKITVYNQYNDVATITENPLFARYRHACVVHQNSFYLFGGVVSSSKNLVIVDTEKWEPVCSFDLPILNRINHAAVSFGEWIYVIGGVDKVSKQPLPHLRFRLMNGEVIIEHVLKSLPSLRYHTAMPLNNERILVVGGLLGEHRFESNDVIMINPKTEAVSFIWLENHNELMLLGADNMLVDGLKLFGLGRKRTVCFSMGSHRDSLWSLDFSHLHFPSFVSIVSDFALSLETPYVIRGHDTFNSFCKSIKSDVLDLMGSRRIAVHKCATPKLKFYPGKNFVFETKDFKDVIQCMEEDECYWYYFRALSEENARKHRADFWHDFPEISKFLSKSAIPIPEDRWHSSILRMSSARGLCLWTHYDVMSNFLIQIRGQKKVTLWPPSDLPYLYIQGSSSIADLSDLEKYPNLLKASPVEVMLGAGDVLFIPALWFHHVECVGEEWSLALNVFWRDLPADFYPKKDLYGNADPILDPHLLPEPFKSFYLTKHQL